MHVRFYGHFVYNKYSPFVSVVVNAGVAVVVFVDSVSEA
jgi:hypothetical protein